jgi:hypothetical protein
VLPLVTKFAVVIAGVTTRKFAVDTEEAQRIVAYRASLALLLKLLDRAD